MEFKNFLSEIPEGDLVILNDTQVLKRRIFSEGREILFLKSNILRNEWEVLFSSRDLKIGSELTLPGAVKIKLLKKGRPQVIQSDRPLMESYFKEFAELPLPPYIQKARNERHNFTEDQDWYQTSWAQKPGSLAAPTASLHFKSEDLHFLEERKVQIATLTLHVGLGTFLPLSDENFQSGVLHSEWVEVPVSTWERILETKKRGHKVWALGTTVLRSLESAAIKNQLEFETDLFIRQGFEFKIVDNLMTNCHQPQSSLLSLVMAFSGQERTRLAYQMAIDKKMRLFSYGDFSVWKRS
jgi:S-adenosylmethionine:tRNA ribosyltransferase-isomerase